MGDDRNIKEDPCIITDAFFAVDRSWAFTYVNFQAEPPLEHGPRELVGKQLWVEYPGVRGSDFERLYRRTMTDGIGGSVVAFYPDHGRWYEAHAYPSPDGISICCHDVTERSGGDKALLESVNLLRGISDTTGDVIFAKDRQGRMQFANPATLALIGKPLDQVLGKTDAEFLDDALAAKSVMENDRAIMDSGSPADIEEVVPLPDGTRRIWSSRKMPNTDADGVVVGLLGVSRDVTEQKLAWERMRSAYDVAAALAEAVTLDDVVQVTVHQGILAAGATAGSLALLADDDTHFEIVASVGYPSSMTERWGRFSAETPIPLAECVKQRRPIYVLSPKERLDRFPILAALDGKDGTRSSACFPLVVGGRMLGSLGLSFSREGDFPPQQIEFMTLLSRQCAQALERARLLDAERRARADAEHASRMKDEFLATLSHELRTPLNAILGWSTILATGESDETTRNKGLATIQRNARAQTHIIEDLLDMSRIISGKVRLEVQRTDLVAVLQAAIDTAKPTADAKGLRLRTVLDPEAGPVSGDPSRLQQVFWNLLQNAIKFTPKGGQIEVVLARVGSHVEISVGDNGQGIETDFLRHVFDRFRQADSSTARRHGGLGIGLSLVKQLVELHGGSVRAESLGLGHGSLFVVSLPQTIVHANPEPEGSERRHPTSASNQPALTSERLLLSGVNILVVDDEPDARDLVRFILESSGAVVRAAGSAQEALELFAASRTDVIVSDVGMPNEDGYTLIGKIRELGAARGGDTPAVALTAYARTDDRIRAVRAGFQAHVVKPVQQEELVAIVKSLSTKRNLSPSDF